MILKAVLNLENFIFGNTTTVGSFRDISIDPCFLERALGSPPLLDVNQLTDFFQQIEYGRKNGLSLSRFG